MKLILGAPLLDKPGAMVVDVLFQQTAKVIQKICMEKD